MSETSDTSGTYSPTSNASAVKAERQIDFAIRILREDQLEKIARAIFAQRYDHPYHPIPWVLNAARAVQSVVKDSPI